MTTGKITRRSVDDLKPGAKDEILWDSEMRGFGVKVTVKGTKTYLVQYRTGGRTAKTQRWTIGQDGIWSPSSAREKAAEILRQVGSGVDPRAEAKAQVAGEEALRLENERLEFKAYADRFLAGYGKPKWRPRTYTSAESNLRRWVVPVLSGKSLLAIGRRDVTAVLDGLPDASPALPRNIFALIRKLFSWAVERGDLARSPMEGMTGPDAVASRDRVLADHELVSIAATSEALGRPFGNFFRLLIVTGQRRTEVAALCWSELDRARAEWAIPSQRSKNAERHVVPLNALAIVELDELAGGSHWPAKGFVLTTSGRAPISGYSKAKKRLDRHLDLDLPGQVAPWRIHDLRRTFATAMQRLGVRLEVTEALLNHVSGATSGLVGVYQRHDWAPEKRAAMTAWGEHMTALIQGADVGGKRPSQ